jgi:hypothetical protein
MPPSVMAVQSFRGGRKCPKIKDFGAERFETLTPAEHDHIRPALNQFVK